MFVINSKRGAVTELSLNPIIVMILTFVVLLLPLLRYANYVGESSNFDQNFLARDISLLVDTLYITPNNLYLDYTGDTFWYTYDFKDNILEVYDSKFETPLPFEKGAYIFTEDSRVNLKKNKLIPKIKYKKKEYDKNNPAMSLKLTLSKTGNKIKVDKRFRPNLNLLSCSDIKIDKIFGEEGIEFVPSYSFIGQSVSKDKSFNEKYVIDPIITQLQTSFQKNKESNIIILKIGNYDENKNFIKAFILNNKNRDNSKILACYIINSILEINELSYENIMGINGASIILTDSLDKKYEINDLENKVVVLLEIGNIQIDERKNVLRFSGSIAKAIESAIKKYYALSTV